MRRGQSREGPGTRRFVVGGVGEAGVRGTQASKAREFETTECRPVKTDRDAFEGQEEDGQLRGEKMNLAKQTRTRCGGRKTKDEDDESIN